MTNASQSNLNVIVVGGGFGGIRAARTLSQQHGVTVTLISNLPTFAYYPQLYHAATGGSRSQSALPLAELLSGTGVKLVQDVIVGIDPVAKVVTSADGHTSYQYDKLVMALGSVTNFFGIAGLKEFSFGIKSIIEAERFKRHLHEQLLSEHKPDLNYVVIGGGPTGVELAGSLAGYLRRIVKLHGLEWRDPNVALVEAAPRILPRSTEAVSARVQKRLEALGVKVLTGATVKAETAEELQLGGQSIATRTVVWTAGVATNPFYYANGAHFQLAKGGRVMVSEHLEGKEDVYVIGDNAVSPFGGLAQTAIVQADFVARDIAHLRAGKTRPPFKQSTPINVLPVGEHWAVAEWGTWHLFGYLGWVLRRCADLIAYADVEAWPQAIRVWLQDSRHEDNCQICSKSIDKTAQQV